jgi:pyruvate formate-lyase/glycerol dehydratase family glycyl radical enzyme
MAGSADGRKGWIAMEQARRESAVESRGASAGERIARLKAAVHEAAPGLCGQRALIWTTYARDPANRSKHVYLRIAEALRSVLLEKTITIYPDELIVGNYSSYRVGGSPHPELSGILPILEIFSMAKRKVNPLQVSREDARRLFAILPFWLRHGMMSKAYASSRGKRAALYYKQFRGASYIINELGGISHVAPDYERLMSIGAEGIARDSEKYQAECGPGSDEWYFHEAVKTICEGLARFGERYAALAEDLAGKERDPDRERELLAIAAVCRRVPRQGATSFREALQALVFGQIAVILEGLDNSVCPGRMDQYLFPFYRRDHERGVIDRERAKQLLACFTLKTCELVPAFNGLVSQYYGGLTNFQTVIVGGVDREGNDATNELSYVFLELMDELRTRQPNYQARIHANAPRPYIEKIYDVLARGSSSPAVYNDDVIVPTLVGHGYRVEDAREYAAIGCVEPAAQGKSFPSTDAAVCNVPILVELALNRGRKFGGLARLGAKTEPASSMKSMDEVKEAFERQLTHTLTALVADLKEAERINAVYHPTPLTSALLKGCQESGKCSTRGGAQYNYSGVQCVGPADTGDALYALDRLVFKDKRLTLPQLVRALKANLPDERLLALMKNLPKFGNDDPEVDAWTLYVVDRFERTLASLGKNTRGGDYVTGLYSVTAHRSFGRRTGALPHGRRQGESFASGIAPVNGMDRKGPTAMLNSINRIDMSRINNGINLNIKFDASMFNKRSGRAAIQALMQTYFLRGGMQAQINSLDPAILEQARQYPDRHPTLLVRVSGYSAYFNDLSPDLKDEIIARTCNRLNV